MLIWLDKVFGDVLSVCCYLLCLTFYLGFGFLFRVALVVDVGVSVLLVFTGCLDCLIVWVCLLGVWVDCLWFFWFGY